jgi:peroxin-12
MTMTTTTTTTMSDHVNPSIPTTVGGLMAEEASMDPYSPLPSFLEMMMIEEAASSADRALESALQALAEKAARLQRTQDSDSTMLRIRAKIARAVEVVAKNYGPELKCFTKYVVERRCLRLVNATASESIYGGRRVRLGGKGQLSEMNDKDRTRLALLLTFSSYMKERLDRLFDQCRQRRNSNACNTTTVSKLRWLFVTVYPFLHMTQEGCIVAYQFMFLVNKSLYFDPASHFLGLVVRRVTSADTQKPPSSPSPDAAAAAAGTSSSPPTIPSGMMLQIARSAALYGLSTTFIVGWISRIWHTVQNLQHTNQRLVDDMPAPNAPTLLLLQQQQEQHPLDQNQRISRMSTNSRTTCPLCQQPRIHPVASTSGHVFCHKCLLGYVRDHGKCPLTGRECREDHILRLYEPQEQRVV